VKVLCCVLITWEIHQNQIQQTPLLPQGIITDNDDWQYVSDDSNKMEFMEFDSITI
jgi:hypothetical protein